MAVMEEEGDLILLYRDKDHDIFRRIPGDQLFISGYEARLRARFGEGLNDEK